MNLYRVTRTDPGGTNPHTTIYNNRVQAENDHRYNLLFTSFESVLVGYWAAADPELIELFLTE